MDMNKGSGRTLGVFDGFEAAVAVCPETVVPSQWLAEVWGADTEFGNIEEAAELEAALQGYYEGVARTLAEEPEQYQP